MDQVDEYIELLDRANSDLSDIDENTAHEEVNDESTQNENTEAQDSTTTDVKPPPRKKNINRPTLNAARLKGPRGLICIEDMFSKVKFKGRGYEQHDLHKIMANLQYWCHRLFPKFTFDDCLAQLEKLGTQRPVMTLKKKILYNMIDDILAEQNNAELNDDVNDPEEVTESQMEAINEFDKLRDPIPTHIPDPPQATATVQLTHEQKEMIERNRQLAAERRRARLEAMQQKQEEMSISQDSETSNSQNSSLTDEQKSMIEKNRLLAIERRRQLQNKSLNSQSEISSQDFEASKNDEITKSTSDSQILEIVTNENDMEICNNLNETTKTVSNFQSETNSQSLETPANENEISIPINDTTRNAPISQSLETVTKENEMEVCVSSLDDTTNIATNTQSLETPINETEMGVSVLENNSQENQSVDVSLPQNTDSSVSVQ